MVHVISTRYLTSQRVAPCPSKVLSDRPHSPKSAINCALLDSTLSSYLDSGTRLSSHSPSSALVATPVSRTLVSSPLETSVCSVSTPSSLPSSSLLNAARSLPVVPSRRVSTCSSRPDSRRGKGYWSPATNFPHYSTPQQCPGTRRSPSTPTNP